MWIVWVVIIILSISLYTQYHRRQKLISLAELFKIQSNAQQKTPQIDEISIGYIYGMARRLSSNVSKSKKDFLELAGLIYGTNKANQAMLALLEYSTQEDSKKKTFIKAANTAMEDVNNMSALLSSHDPLGKNTQTKMPEGLSRLYKEQKKKS